jgi:hypothetical protein
MFENMVLRIFGLKRDEVAGERRKLNNVSFTICTLPNIIKIIKSRRMR